MGRFTNPVEFGSRIVKENTKEINKLENIVMKIKKFLKTWKKNNNVYDILKNNVKKVLPWIKFQHKFHDRVELFFLLFQNNENLAEFVVILRFDKVTTSMQEKYRMLRVDNQKKLFSIQFDQINKYQARSGI